MQMVCLVRPWCAECRRREQPAAGTHPFPGCSLQPTGAAVLRMLRAWANRDNKQMPLPTFETVPGATPKQVRCTCHARVVHTLRTLGLLLL